MPDEIDYDEIKVDLDKALNSNRLPSFVRFCLAVLSGAVPVVGGFIGGASGAWSEQEQQNINQLLAAWMKLLEEEIKEIGQTIVEVYMRIDPTDPKVKDRIESKEYLSLMRKSFRDWSAAESEEKRIYIRNLLSNAAAPTQLCSDDVIRLFIKWIDDYSEAHFQIVKAVYNQNGISRAEIWTKIHGEHVREDAPEADLFKLLIRDLSTGGIIRQIKPKDPSGNFVRQRSRRSRGRTLTSAFDDEKPYELTELGKWFVHYTMNEIVPRLADT